MSNSFRPRIWTGLFLTLALGSSPFGDSRAADDGPKVGQVVPLRTGKPADKVPLLADSAGLLEFHDALLAEDTEGMLELEDRRTLAWARSGTKVRVLRLHPHGFAFPMDAAKVRVMDGPVWKGKEAWIYADYLRPPEPE